MSEELNPEYLEKLILKTFLSNKQYCVLMSSECEARYFDNMEASSIFNLVRKHYEQYYEIPNNEFIVNSCKDKDNVKEYLDDLENIELCTPEVVFDNTETWLKEVAFKYAIMDSVDLVKSNEDITKARDYIESALVKTLKKDIGLDYWGDMAERLKRMFNAEDNRIPSYFPQLDEYINGGFPAYTLNVFVAAMHGYKSNTMINIATRQMMHGHTVVYITLEMAEDEVAKRIDANLTKLDINRIYDTKKKEFLTNIKNVKSGKNGQLLIKQFPTSTASANDFRSYYYELKMRGIEPECIFVDYLNIMKPSSGKTTDGNLYTDVKRIGEEVRAFSFTTNCPIISCTQTTRSGITANIQELDFSYLSESIGTAATADSMFVLGTDDDSLVYQNEIFYKILKNRLGGQVGTIDRLYIDNKSLKMYDSTEMDIWLNDAISSGGDREMAS